MAAVVLGIRFILKKNKIQKVNTNYGVQFVIFIPLFQLTRIQPGPVIEATVYKIPIIPTLDFNIKNTSGFISSLDIEDRFFLIKNISHGYRIPDNQGFDRSNPSVNKYGVDKVLQQGKVFLLPQQDTYHDI